MTKLTEYTPENGTARYERIEILIGDTGLHQVRASVRSFTPGRNNSVIETVSPMFDVTVDGDTEEFQAIIGEVAAKALARVADRDATIQEQSAQLAKLTAERDALLARVAELEAT
jgi:acid stress-induced BolA-like protein IbaG/YrbA